jgi:hypothetical protein
MIHEHHSLIVCGLSARRSGLYVPRIAPEHPLEFVLRQAAPQPSPADAWLVIQLGVKEWTLILPDNRPVAAETPPSALRCLVPLARTIRP